MAGENIQCAARTEIGLHQRASIPDVLAARPGIPRAVGVVIEKSLSKRPADRWQTADAMRIALRNAAGS